MLERGSLNQKTQNNYFMESKRKPVIQFNDPIWISDVAFFADITRHLNILNKKFQSPKHLTHNLFDCVKSFECKLYLWQNQLRKFNLTHLEELSQCETYDVISISLH